jgi:hypothetical protein
MITGKKIFVIRKDYGMLWGQSWEIYFMGMRQKIIFRQEMKHQFVQLSVFLSLDSDFSTFSS